MREEGAEPWRASRPWRIVVSAVALSMALSSCADLDGASGGQVPQPESPQPESPQPSDGQTSHPDGPTPQPERPAQAGTAEVAVYMGWRDTGGIDTFANWLGRPVWAHDFLDHRQGWGVIADPRAQLAAWDDWVAQDDQRRLVLSVPLLTESTAGDFAGGARGAYDRHFTQLAESLVAHGLDDTVIRLGWEFNGNTFPWAVSAGQVGDYKRFWNRVVKAMRGVEGAHFAFDWCPNITLDATGLPFAQLYPGDDTVDIIGLGFYDYYWDHPSASPEDRWAWLRDSDNGLADHRDFAAAHDKPTSFPEYGLWEAGTRVGGGGDDPYFVRQFAAWVASNNVAYHGYNNVDATADHRLTSYPRSRQAFLDAFGG
jgi:Glycosyl hydrolase family 26